MLWISAAGLSTLAWLYLLLGHGRFWRADQALSIGTDRARGAHPWPRIGAVIPARNEAPHITGCLESLLAQDYPGTLDIVVVDDHSEDRLRPARVLAGPAAGDRRRIDAAVLGAARGHPLRADDPGFRPPPLDPAPHPLARPPHRVLTS